MSVRAHRITKLEYNSPSFNLWHDKEFVEYLQNVWGIEDEVITNGGLIEIPRKALEDFIKMSEEEEMEVDKELIEKLKKDLAETEDEFISYYCF